MPAMAHCSSRLPPGAPPTPTAPMTQHGIVLDHALAEQSVRDAEGGHEPSRDPRPVTSEAMHHGPIFACNPYGLKGPLPLAVEARQGGADPPVRLDDG